MLNADDFCPTQRLRDRHKTVQVRAAFPSPTQSRGQTLIFILPMSTWAHNRSDLQQGEQQKKSKRRAQDSDPICSICSPGVHQRLAFPGIHRRGEAGRQAPISPHHSKNATKWRPRPLLRKMIHDLPACLRSCFMEVLTKPYESNLFHNEKLKSTALFRLKVTVSSHWLQSLLLVSLLAQPLFTWPA